MNLLRINYNFPTGILLKEALSKDFSVYEDSKHGKSEGWNVYRGDIYDIPEAWNQTIAFCDFYGIKQGQPRYYILEENKMLMPHIDYNTTCSVNHILNEDAAPVTIMGEEYTYKSALLNTTVMHGVNNIGRKKRVLFKISFFEQTYEEIREQIQSREATFSIA